jgi:hypothetical protein
MAPIFMNVPSSSFTTGTPITKLFLVPKVTQQSFFPPSSSSSSTTKANITKLLLAPKIVW